MDIIIFIKALILGVIEGLTEFLPISSTGHLILAGDLLHFNDERGKVFEIAIQVGAILAVVWDYRPRFRSLLTQAASDAAARRLWLNLIVAFIPAAALGLLFGKSIKQYLFAPVPVALAFIIGGLVILWAEKRRHVVRLQSVDDMGPWDALKIGLAQCFALIPGTSRSGATIIGGLFFGLSRTAAAEFSFFLAVPTLGAASAYELFKARHLLHMEDVGLLAAGFVAAFLSAMVAVRVFIRFVSKHDFAVFAWYRIVFGLVVLGTAYSGLVDWSQD